MFHYDYFYKTNFILDECFVNDVLGTYEVTFYLSSGVSIYISLSAFMVAFWNNRRRQRNASTSYTLMKKN